MNEATCTKLYKDFGNLPAKFVGVVIMMIMAIIFQGIAMITGTVAAMRGKTLNWFILALYTAAVLAGVGSLSTYASYYGDQKYKLSWSYALGWLGTSCVGICIILMCVIMSQQGQNRR